MAPEVKTSSLSWHLRMPAIWVRARFRAARACCPSRCRLEGLPNPEFKKGRAWAFACAVWAAPRFGKRLYVGWMSAAVPVGWTVSLVILALVYYLVVTPIAWILRLRGYDPLQRRFDDKAESYWIERGTPGDSSRYFKQF